MKHRAHIVHQMPGRVRIKIPSARGNPDLLEEVRHSFDGVPGLHEVVTKPDSGSIVLLYDPEITADLDEQLRKRWKQALPTLKVKARHPRELPGNEFETVSRQLEAEAEFLAGHSQWAKAVVDLFKLTDREIKLLTNNAIDLKIVLAIGLAAATFVGVGAHAATPMWVTLGLFAINHFLEMHPHTKHVMHDKPVAMPA
jgi:hypothetical protein